MTQCTSTQLKFQSFGRRKVVGRFDAGRPISDTGEFLLSEMNQRFDSMR